jgi:hypothetical protein
VLEKQYAKSIGLIFGAAGFSFNAGNIVHEFGHMVADWISGIPFSSIHVIVHPFFAPYIKIDGGRPDSLMGWPDAAGPLANVLFGLIVFTLLWKRRNPFLFPLLLWGPLACVQEGLGQILTISDPGSDAFLMVAAGLPQPVLIVICILLLIIGILLFGLVFPIAGLSPGVSAFKRLAILLGGMLPYGIITLLICLLAGTAQDISRSYNIIGGFAVIAVIITVLNTPIRLLMDRFRARMDFKVKWSHTFFSIGLLAIIVVLQLLFLN